MKNNEHVKEVTRLHETNKNLNIQQKESECAENKNDMDVNKVQKCNNNEKHEYEYLLGGDDKIKSIIIS